MNSINSSIFDLRYFVETTKTLNLTKAARNLGITQPTLSMAIKRLERFVGGSLLIRSKSGVKLTRLGTEISLRARELLGKWEALPAFIESHSNIAGKYSVGIHASLAIHILPQFLPELMLNYPQLDVRLVHNVSRKVCDQVIDSEIDFGILINPTPHPELIIRKLGSDIVGFFCKAPERVNDDFTGMILIYDPEILQSQCLMKELHKKNIYFKRRVFTHRLDVITTLTCESGIIGIVPKRQADIIAGKKIVLMSQLPKIEHAIYLVYRRDMQQSHVGKTIARFIEDGVRSHLGN